MIVSERQRPLWQRLIASLFFTVAIGLLIYVIFMMNWNDDNAINIGHYIKVIIYLDLVAFFLYIKVFILMLGGQNLDKRLKLGQ